MLQNLFLEMHQTLEQLNEQFDDINNIDEELSLLEKYLSIKEVSEELTEEINTLNIKLNQLEREHGLFNLFSEISENSFLREEQHKETDNEEVVIELFEEDFLTFQKGIGFYDLWMHDKAIVYLEDIIKKYPDFNLARLYTAMTYLKRKDYNNTRKEVLTIFEFSDDNIINSLAHNILGITYGQQGEYEQAMLHFQHAIDLKEDWKEPKFNLGIMYYKLNQYTEAISLFEDLYNINSKDWEAMLYIGKCYQKLKEYDKANWYFNETYAISKKPIVIKKIATYYEKHNQLQKAIYWYKKWLNIEPKQLQALLGMAKNLWLMGDKNSGLTLIKKALTLESNNLEILLIYAWMLTDTNCDKALTVIDKISVNMDKDSDIISSYMIASLARLYYLNDEKNKADKFCAMLLNSKNSSLNSLGNIVLGLINLDENKPEQALNNFNNLIDNEAIFPYLDFYIGYSHYLLGNLEAAKNSWGNFIN